MDETPIGSEQVPPAAANDPAWGPPNPNYPPPAGAYPPSGDVPPGYVPPPGYAQPVGLSDTAASALAYLTFIPAIIFLVMAPYNQKPVIKFHAIQELGISVVMFVLSFFLVIPILGQLIYFIGGIGLFVLWVLCIIKASQGHVFKLPFIGDFAAQQSGYKV